MISALVFTLNDQDRISETLCNLADLVNEIVVVDWGSQDKTITIARSLGALVFVDLDRRSFLHASNLCSHDWIINVEVDEKLSERLKQEITFIFSAEWCNRYHGYRFRAYHSKSTYHHFAQINFHDVRIYRKYTETNQGLYYDFHGHSLLCNNSAIRLMNNKICVVNDNIKAEQHAAQCISQRLINNVAWIILALYYLFIKRLAMFGTLGVNYAYKRGMCATMAGLRGLKPPT